MANKQFKNEKYVICQMIYPMQVCHSSNRSGLIQKHQHIEMYIMLRSLRNELRYIIIIIQATAD